MMADIERLVARLKEFDALRDTDDIVRGTVDRIQPQFEDRWPPELHPAVCDALGRIGISSPYQHQAKAIRKSLSGADVVMESPTASGKTLAFAAPMLDALVRNPGSHALMIYPMKALALDQREQIRQLCEKLPAPHGVESWPYDGDTPDEQKKAIRSRPPQILLTNPEYLHLSFLQWGELWEGFLRNLRYVVIDEMHEYRGFFGGNMALLLRRFFLKLNRLGAYPRVFLATATCANPQEHAKSLTGRDVGFLSAREVLRPRRHFIFVNPDVPDFRYRDILQLRVEHAALATLSEGLQVLIFCPTKRFLEEALRRCKQRATEQGLDADKLAPFHADLRSDVRQDTQRDIKSGDVQVVFTTNALELGLDIGGLDGVILAGFPTNVMSAWQQIGRAGRGWDKDSFVLFYAMNDPIDQFFVGNLPAFLDKPYDALTVDPENEELIENHLPSLLADAGGQLSTSDNSVLGDAFYHAARKEPGTLPKGYKPHKGLDIRGSIGPSFALKSGSEDLGQISASRRFREAYIGAIFTFMGRRYRVRSHEEEAVVLADAEPNMKTEPGFYTVSYERDILDSFCYGNIETYYGRIDIITNFTGYTLVDEHTGEGKGTGGAPDTLFQRNLHAFWIKVLSDDEAVAGIGALEHMLRVGAMFAIPVDRFDASTFSRGGEDPTAFYYENYTGGIGVAKKLFEVWITALIKGVEIASSCKCRRGCVNCIEPPKSYINAAIDKRPGIELANSIFSRRGKGPRQAVPQRLDEAGVRSS